MIRSIRGAREVAFRVLAALALLVGTSLAASTPPAGGQAPPSAGDSTLPDLTQIKQDLEVIRGLKFLRDVPAEKQSLDDFGAFLQTELDKMFPPGKAEDIQAGLMRLGLLLEPIDLGHEFKNALLSQAGAYYDPGSGKFFYLMTNVSSEMLQMIASHELVHAIQDQHFHLGPLLEDLDRTYREGTRQDDQMLAVRYLVEGEATYVQTLWQVMGAQGRRDPHSRAFRQAQRQAHMILRIQGAMDMALLVQANKLAVTLLGDAGDEITEAIQSMDQIPPYILHPLIAAYTGGAVFVLNVRQQGGWDAVSAAYTNLPQSSEQVLHPEKFTGARDNPTPMTLPEMTYLGESGWRAVDSAVHGEFYLNLLLRNFGSQAGDAMIAAAGWDGDIYQAWRREDGRVMFALATTWDTEQDAAEFLEAYRSILRTKCGLDADPPTEPDESGAIVYASGDGIDDVGRLAQRGREVFIVEGAPAELGRRILADLMAVEIEYVD